MGTVLCLLDLPLHRSNIGSMDFPSYISTLGEAKEAAKGKEELKRQLNRLIALVLDHFIAI